jgi:hypothetical protein
VFGNGKSEGAMSDLAGRKNRWRWNDMTCRIRGVEIEVRGIAWNRSWLGGSVRNGWEIFSNDTAYHLDENRINGY